jgi:hypothetical protein
LAVEVAVVPTAIMAHRVDLVVVAAVGEQVLEVQEPQGKATVEEEALLQVLLQIDLVAVEEQQAQEQQELLTVTGEQEYNGWMVIIMVVVLGVLAMEVLGVLEELVVAETEPPVIADKLLEPQTLEVEVEVEDILLHHLRQVVVV